MAPFASIDAYIKAQVDPGRAYAEELRALIKSAAPKCDEAIKYNMPAFQIGGKSFLYFAVWKKHVGLYPVYRGDSAFEAKLTPYRAEKDTVQFKYDAPLPKMLIKAIARAQAARLRTRLKP